MITNLYSHFFLFAMRLRRDRIGGESKFTDMRKITDPVRARNMYGRVYGDITEALRSADLSRWSSILSDLGYHGDQKRIPLEIAAEAVRIYATGMSSEILGLRRQNLAAETDKAAAIEQLRAGYEQRLLHAANDASASDARHTAEYSALEARYQEKTQEARAGALREIGLLNIAHQATLDGILSAHAEELERLGVAHAGEITRLESHAANLDVQLGELEALREEYSGLRGALMEHSLGDLGERDSLANYVDYLARVPGPKSVEAFYAELFAGADGPLTKAIRQSFNRSNLAVALPRISGPGLENMSEPRPDLARMKRIFNYVFEELTGDVRVDFYEPRQIREFLNNKMNIWAGLLVSYRGDKITPAIREQTSIPVLQVKQFTVQAGIEAVLRYALSRT